MQIFRSIIVPLLGVSILAVPASAEVIDASAGGFTVKLQVSLPAPRAVVYAAVVNEVGQWWSSDHTVSGDAANMYINAVPQGCFCERLGDGAGVVHMEVTFVNPGVILRLTGGLGPLGLLGVNGNMTWEFDEAGEGGSSTVITMRYAVGGYRPEGLGELAPAVDQVLTEQLLRLQAHVAKTAAP
jgi:uncharacterized protein YndB with AHSA1/START domain